MISRESTGVARRTRSSVAEARAFFANSASSSVPRRPDRRRLTASFSSPARGSRL